MWNDFQWRHVNRPNENSHSEKIFLNIKNKLNKSIYSIPDLKLSFICCIWRKWEWRIWYFNISGRKESSKFYGMCRTYIKEMITKEVNNKATEQFQNIITVVIHTFSRKELKVWMKSNNLKFHMSNRKIEVLILYRI